MPGLDHSVQIIMSFFLRLEIFQNGLLKIKRQDKVHHGQIIIITEKIMEYGLMKLRKMAHINQKQKLKVQKSL